MKKHKMEYLIVFLLFVLFCLAPCIPKTTSKYVERKTKKVTINAVQPTYTIIFDANGGNGEMSNQVFTYSVAGNLHSNTFTNEVGTFNGWNTVADGSGDDYEDEAYIYNLTSTNGATITLYAQWTDKVARIGNTYYDTLTEAVAVANASSEQTTIVLLKNTNENIIIANGKSVILNLGGNTLGNVGNDNTIKNNGTLVLRNGKVTNDAPTNGAINNYVSGNLTVDGVNVTVIDTGNRQALYNEKGVVTISGGSTLTSKSTARPAVTNVSGGTMIITDAVITSTGASGLKNDGNLTIGSSSEPVSNSNPKIKGKNYGLETSKNVVFYDGIIMGATAAVDNSNRLTSLPSGYMVVSDEEVITGTTYYEKFVDRGVTITLNPNGGILAAGDTTKVVGVGRTVGTLPEPTKSGKIFEGWYTEVNDGEEVLPTRIVNENVTFYAHWANNSCVAKIGETMYDSLQEAVDAASDAELTSIELLKDTSEVVTIDDTKNIQLNLGENTITNSGNKAVITNNGSLSITGGLITSNANFAAVDNLAGILYVNDVHVVATGLRQALYVSSGEVTISGDSYLTSQTTGTASTTPMQRGTVQCLPGATLNITGGTIVAENQHAVTNEGTLTIGVKDGIVGTTSPTLIGKIDGIKSTGTLNFYDGIIKGETTAIEGTIDDIEVNTTVIDEVQGQYKVAYLAENDNSDNSNNALSTLSLSNVDNIPEITDSIAENELQDNTLYNNVVISSNLVSEELDNNINEDLEDDTNLDNPITSQEDNNMEISQLEDNTSTNVLENDPVSENSIEVNDNKNLTTEELGDLIENNNE